MHCEISSRPPLVRTEWIHAKPLLSAHFTKCYCLSVRSVGAYRVLYTNLPRSVFARTCQTLIVLESVEIYLLWHDIYFWQTHLVLNAWTFTLVLVLFVVHIVYVGMCWVVDVIVMYLQKSSVHLINNHIYSHVKALLIGGIDLSAPVLQNINQFDLFGDMATPPDILSVSRPQEILNRCSCVLSYGYTTPSE